MSPEQPPSPASPVGLADTPRDPWWTSAWPHASEDPAVRQARDLAPLMDVFDQRRAVIGMSRSRLSELAAKAGVGRTTVVDLWRGQSWPTYRTLHRVGEVLGVAIIGLYAEPPTVEMRRPIQGAQVIDALNKASPETRQVIIGLLQLEGRPAR